MVHITSLMMMTEMVLETSVQCRNMTPLVVREDFIEFSRTYECVSKSFRTGRLERALQMVQLSANRCS